VHTLPDGTQILIRPIEATDKLRLSVALGRLSRETIHRRFLAAKPRLSTAELRYLTEIDGHDHIALVAEIDGELIAVARSVRFHDRPDTAEMAIVVADRWQHRGIGTALAEALTDAAVATGIRRIAAVMLADNEPARRLLRRIAAHLERATLSDGAIRDGVREVLIELEPRAQAAHAGTG
jgi:RimJ/RimL family protein N-acetyltransferase